MKDWHKSRNYASVCVAAMFSVLRRRLALFAVESIGYIVDNAYVMAVLCFMEQMSETICSVAAGDANAQEGFTVRTGARVRGLFSGKNVAFICDGNRRYLKKRGFKDDFLREEGLMKMNELIHFGYRHCIEEVSFLCFSLKNLGRFPDEASGLMEIIKSERYKMVTDTGLRPKFKVYGKMDLLERDVRERFSRVEEETKDNTDITVNIFFAYSAEEELSRGALFDGRVDVLIRTGCVRRLSDFMLHQVSKGTAVFFPSVLWPEFTTMHAYLILLQNHLEDKYLLSLSMQKDV